MNIEILHRQVIANKNIVILDYLAYDEDGKVCDRGTLTTPVKHITASEGRAILREHGAGGLAYDGLNSVGVNREVANIDVGYVVTTEG